MWARVLICASLGLTLGCGSRVRTIDVRGVEGPALAFAVGIEQGLPVSVSQVIMLDDDGNVAQAPAELPGEGTSTRLLIVKNADLLVAAASFGKHIMQDQLPQSRLVVRSPAEMRPIDYDDGAWLALPVPVGAIQRPESDDLPLQDYIELEVPLRNNHACAMGGVIRDLGVSYRQPTRNWDIAALGNGRLLAVHGSRLSIAQQDDVIDLDDSSDPRVFGAAGNGLFFEAVERIPSSNNEVWVAGNMGGGGALIRLGTTNGFEILEQISVSAIRPSSLGVGPQGAVVAGGPQTDGSKDSATIVYQQGALTVVPTLNRSLSRSIVAEPGTDTFITGAVGALLKHRLGSTGWTSSLLNHRRGHRFPNAIALKQVVNGHEVYVASNDGVLLKQQGEADAETVELVSPPDYRCHAGNAVVSLNFESMVVYDNRFALLGMYLCSDILVVDLDNPSCTAFIPYEGDAVTSASYESLDLEGDRLWIGGDDGELRYVDLVAP